MSADVPAPAPASAVAPASDVVPDGPGTAPGDGSVAFPAAVDSFGRPPRARRRRRRAVPVWALVLTVVASLVAGGVGGVLGTRWLDDRRPADAQLPLAPVAAGDVELTGVAAIAQAVLPSVVAIEVRTATGGGTGSGFVLRDDGYVLTNNHVVDAAADGGEIVVVFADGSEEEAELVGRTSEYDLAVIKVDREGLTPLVLGDSDEVVVGEPVVAIGAPLGLASTVTTGIVSALNRPVTAGDPQAPAFINAIQTDAAINPGNSGGPLVNVRGEVIGINSAIAQAPGATQQSAGSIGLGFAIPSEQARRTAEQLIETGHATYPVIGALLDQRYVGEGVQVSAEAQEGTPPLTPDGPADRAGIEPGDVILAIDGRPVTAADELIVAIRAKAPGDAVVLTVRDGDGEREVRVVLDEFTGN
ncbi:S1C family serine protease [Actinotalea fermentans]|uniref:S1C family serine protease n=1 Tax=Actinotalea fermentans TaxID=43671 RepID=UPI0021C1BEB1|nr:trypsin-like peptidase domain-containing protein [Actinotalea fermentans]